MPPPKRAPKSSKKQGKKEAQTPQTANEYLEAADEEEVTGSKWRPGDAAKAMRAYSRAFAIYEEGLAKFPKDFDLAYNKANLQYLVVTDARLRAQSQASTLGLLDAALVSHRYALSLDESNADVLYNTAQVLTSIAEELENGDDDEADDEQDQEVVLLAGRTIPLLQEAIELFEACAAKQEMQFEETMASIEGQGSEEMVDEAPQEAIAQDGGDEKAGEEWAVVAQPVTPISLLETSTAILNAMTSLVEAYVAAHTASGHGAAAELAAVTSLAREILQVRIPTNLIRLENMPQALNETDNSHVLSLSTTSGQMSRQQSLDPKQVAKIEVKLAAALFIASVAEAEYALQVISINEYAARLKDAFETGVVNLEPSQPSIMFAYAQALADFAAAVVQQERKGNLGADTSLQNEASTAAWQSLSLADEGLAKVISVLEPAAGVADVSPPSKANAYLLRGDVSLARWRLAAKPNAAGAVQAAGATLLKNAGVYYRGAFKLAAASTGAIIAGRQGGDEDEYERIAAEANIKDRIVARLAGKQVLLKFEKGLAYSSDEDLTAVLQDMVDHGLLEEQMISALR